VFLAARSGVGSRSGSARFSPERCGDQDMQVRLGAATVSEPDQVRDQWRVRPLAAPVRGFARELEKRLDITR
jgi:hypothetical protein